MTQLDGNFETHLTVDATADIDALQAWAETSNVKFTHIVLSQGQTASQPMLTFHGSGNLAAQLDRAESISADLKPNGFHVNRVKVEVGTNHPDVPREDCDATGLSEQNYFEFHIKLKLPQPAESLTQSITEIAIKHSAHLSRNAFRKHTNGFEERFVTQRGYQIGSSTATKRFESLRAELAYVDLAEILEVEEEFVIYDSNHSIDQGWIKEQGDR